MLHIYSPPVEVEPTNGWRNFEPSGLVVLVATDEDAKTVLRVVGEAMAQQARPDELSP